MRISEARAQESVFISSSGFLIQAEVPQALPLSLSSVIYNLVFHNLDYRFYSLL